MSEDTVNHQMSVLAGVARQYPEKTFYLGQVFTDTTNSYKLFWFLAILALLKQDNVYSLRLVDVFTEMTIAAWHPLCLFRLSLGRQDKLEGVILEFQQQSGLPPNATSDAIRKFVEGSADAQRKLGYFKRYVPTRFLTPWFGEQLRGEGDDMVRTRTIQIMAKESQQTQFASLYYFDVESEEVERWCPASVRSLKRLVQFSRKPLSLTASLGN